MNLFKYGIFNTGNSGIHVYTRVSGVHVCHVGMGVLFFPGEMGASERQMVSLEETEIILERDGWGISLVFQNCN